MYSIYSSYSVFIYIYFHTSLHNQSLYKYMYTCIYTHKENVWKSIQGTADLNLEWDIGTQVVFYTGHILLLNIQKN